MELNRVLVYFQIQPVSIQKLDVLCSEQSANSTGDFCMRMRVNDQVNWAGPLFAFEQRSWSASVPFTYTGVVNCQSFHFFFFFSLEMNKEDLVDSVFLLPPPSLLIGQIWRSFRFCISCRYRTRRDHHSFLVDSLRCGVRIDDKSTMHVASCGPSCAASWPHAH